MANGTLNYTRDSVVSHATDQELLYQVIFVEVRIWLAQEDNSDHAGLGSHRSIIKALRAKGLNKAT